MITRLSFQKGVSILPNHKRPLNWEEMCPHNIFVNKPGELTLSIPEEDQLLEIANNSGLKCLRTSNLHAFWIKVQAEYPEVATKALKSLLPFPTSCLCEAVFSAVTETKMRLQSRQNISNTIQLSQSPVIPRWTRLVPGKQA